MTATAVKRLLKTKDVAEQLQMHEMTVYRLCRRGKLPYVKIGGDYRFKQEWIDKMFEDCLRELQA